MKIAIYTFIFSLWATFCHAQEFPLVITHSLNVNQKRTTISGYVVSKKPLRVLKIEEENIVFRLCQESHTRNTFYQEYGRNILIYSFHHTILLTQDKYFEIHALSEKKQIIFIQVQVPYQDVEIIFPSDYKLVVNFNQEYLSSSVIPLHLGDVLLLTRQVNSYTESWVWFYKESSTGFHPSFLEWEIDRHLSFMNKVVFGLLVYSWHDLSNSDLDYKKISQVQILIPLTRVLINILSQNIPNLRALKCHFFTNEDVYLLSYLKKLVILNIELTKINGHGLKKLSAYKKLTFLNLRGVKINPPSLTSLQHLISLEVLSLDAVNHKLISLESLVELKRLRILSLQSTNIHRKSWKRLLSLVNLTSLNLSNTNVNGFAIAYICQLNHLHQLNLSSTKVSDQEIINLCQLDGLRFLNLKGSNVKEKGLIHLALFPKLKVLVLDLLPVTDEVLTHLEKLKDLRVLSLASSHIQNPSSLGSFPQLRLVDLYSTQVNDQSIKYLILSKNLATLYLGATQVTNEGLESLLKLDYLKVLSLSWNDKIDSQALKVIGSLESLEQLHLVGTGIIGLEGLERLSQLRTLSLGWTSIPGKSLSEVGKLSELKFLYLQGLNIEDKDLEPLSELSELITLNINHTHITLKGNQATHIAKLDRLQNLFLANIQSDYFGLFDLLTKMENLKLLTIDKKIKLSQAHLLRQIISSCVILQNRF